jgi:hypothetical protein
LFVFVIALRPQTPKHIRGGWSHYTDTSEPVDGGVGTPQLPARRNLAAILRRENTAIFVRIPLGSSWDKDCS